MTFELTNFTIVLYSYVFIFRSEFVKACKTDDSGKVKSLLESTIAEEDFESFYRGLIVASKLKEEKKKR